MICCVSGTSPSSRSQPSVPAFSRVTAASRMPPAAVFAASSPPPSCAGALSSSSTFAASRPWTAAVFIQIGSSESIACSAVSGAEDRLAQVHAELALVVRLELAQAFLGAAPAQHLLDRRGVALADRVVQFVDRRELPAGLGQRGEHLAVAGVRAGDDRRPRAPVRRLERVVGLDERLDVAARPRADELAEFVLGGGGVEQSLVRGELRQLELRVVLGGGAQLVDDLGELRGRHGVALLQLEHLARRAFHQWRGDRLRLVALQRLGERGAHGLRRLGARGQHLRELGLDGRVGRAVAVRLVGERLLPVHLDDRADAVDELAAIALVARQLEDAHVARLFAALSSSSARRLSSSASASAFATSPARSASTRCSCSPRSRTGSTNAGCMENRRDGDRIHRGDLGHRAAPERHHALALRLAEVAAEQLVQLGRVGLEPRVGLGLALARVRAAQQRADASARIGLEIRRVLGLAALEQVVLERRALLGLVEHLDLLDLLGRQPVEDGDHLLGVDLAGGGVKAVPIHGPTVGHVGLVDRALEIVGDRVRVELARAQARQGPGHGQAAAVEPVDRVPRGTPARRGRERGRWPHCRRCAAG